MGPIVFFRSIRFEVFNIVNVVQTIIMNISLIEDIIVTHDVVTDDGVAVRLIVVDTCIDKRSLVFVAEPSKSCTDKRSLSRVYRGGIATPVNHYLP